MRRPSRAKGFTLIELLIVIGIIGFLAASVLVAVDPVRRIQDSRDARRFSEANALLNAILNKQVDDRRIYNGAAWAPIITSATNSQVIVSGGDNLIECDTVSAGLAENFPGCNQTLDTGARTIAGTVTAAGTAVTGSGTDFLTSLRVGDVILIASSGLQPCIVLSIASDTALTCTSAVSYSASTVVARSKNCVASLSDTKPGLGTITTSGTTVTGSGTNFSAQVNVGDTITVSGQELTVASVASTVSLTTTTAASPAIGSAASYTITLANPLVPNYIASVPIDPRGSGATVCQTGCTTNGVGITTLGTTNTGYYLHRTTGNRLEVGACSGEQTTSISVKR